MVGSLTLLVISGLFTFSAKCWNDLCACAYLCARQKNVSSQRYGYKQGRPPSDLRIHQNKNSFVIFLLKWEVIVGKCHNVLRNAWWTRRVGFVLSCPPSDGNLGVKLEFLELSAQDCHSVWTLLSYCENMLISMAVFTHYVAWGQKWTIAILARTAELYLSPSLDCFISYFGNEPSEGFMFLPHIY